MLPSKVNITSPDCVDSITASCLWFDLTKSVALKNSNVAITPEKTATHKDCRVWFTEGTPAFTRPNTDNRNQKGRLHNVIP
ncbi:hypothetical protein LBYZC6_33650 [Lacrimispora brassicae]